jgi:hypothetical protein
MYFSYSCLHSLSVLLALHSPLRTPYNKDMFSRVHFLQLVFVLISGSFLRADTAAFDLAGPRIEVRVTRAGKTLPISKVPNLRAGDRLWIHPDMPDEQAVRFLMIPVFLRGSTNPPPDAWFTKTETWNKRVREEGIVITVPQGAQQALIFLAPETGGDFSTLRAAVRGKPGAFVRLAGPEPGQPGPHASRQVFGGSPGNDQQRCYRPARSLGTAGPEPQYQVG